MTFEDQEYSITDLVKYAYEDQPAKMQDAFNELIMSRVHDSIQQKKVEVAQRFFDSSDDAEEEQLDQIEDEEDEDGQDS